MAYRKVILAEAQQKYRDIVGYLVGVLQSRQAARNFMEEFDKQVSPWRRLPSCMAFLAFLS